MESIAHIPRETNVKALRQADAITLLQTVESVLRECAGVVDIQADETRGFHQRFRDASGHLLPLQPLEVDLIPDPPSNDEPPAEPADPPEPPRCDSLAGSMLFFILKNFVNSDQNKME
jgi:hypothetical protein